MSNQPKHPSDDPSLEYPDLTVVVIDPDRVRWAPEMDDWNAATLLACVSEDPADWSEIAAVWPRYRTGPSAEFADALPLTLVELPTALPQLPADQPWLVLDLQQQRVFSSRKYDDVQRDGCFGLGPNNGFGPEIRMPIHLPPWWLIHNAAERDDVSKPRATEICRPAPRRDVLWGSALADALAESMVAVYGSGQWNRAGASREPSARYPFTVDVHRDWLMTPRSDLDGRIPRDSLHGGMDWIERVIEGQQWHITRAGGPIPVPRDLSSYDDSPMGRSEVCLYFDLCREMINRGWQWLVDHGDEMSAADSQSLASRLATALKQIQHDWMRAPFEDGAPPIAVIQNERDRVPEVAGSGEDGHEVDCDCPICQLMADGMFGPAFVGFDGHHLELDGEFAFSLCETREQWELEQREFAAMSASVDAEIQREKEKRKETETRKVEPAGEFDSVWQSSFVADEGLPGDTLGHLAISFRLAEIIDELQGRSGSRADIDALNRAFRDYRRADPSDQVQRRTATEQFQAALEQTAHRHEFLISRAADLQSQLDELLRHPVEAQPDDDARR